MALCFLVFWPAVLGGFVWDDHTLIVNNLRLQQPGWQLLGDDFWRTSDAGQSARAYYRPVVSLALAAQYQLFGRTAAGYHIVALLLHSACVLLVFDWLRRRLDRTRSEKLDSNPPT